MTRTPRLSVADWIEAGFDVLTTDGPEALRLGRLCRQLGVTKGSFYWHFPTIDSYRAALVQAWAAERELSQVRLAHPADPDPRDQLRRMMTTLLARRHWAVARVMRIWALNDELVATSVRRSDERVLRAASQAFIDAGFEPADAWLRATLTVAANAGLLMTDAAAPNIPPEVRESFLDFMFRP